MARPVRTLPRSRGRGRTRGRPRRRRNPTGLENIGRNPVLQDQFLLKIWRCDCPVRPIGFRSGVVPKAFPQSFRSSVVAAMEAGLSPRQAAQRFGVSRTCAIHWYVFRSTGDTRPKGRGGDRRSGRIEAYAPEILAMLDGTGAGLTLAQLQRRLRRCGLKVSVSTIWRFLDRRGIRLKRSAGPVAQDNRVGVTPCRRRTRRIRRTDQPSQLRVGAHDLEGGPELFQVRR